MWVPAPWAWPTSSSIEKEKGKEDCLGGLLFLPWGSGKGAKEKRTQIAARTEAQKQHPEGFETFRVLV